MRILAWFLAYSGLLAAVLGGGYWWLRQEVEQSALRITASHDKPAEQGEPVFAQFVMTQTLQLQDVAKINRLIIPLQRTRESEDPLVIDLKRRGELQQRWRYRGGTGETAQEISFTLEPPLLLDQNLEIVFSASDVSHDEQESAPRIFIEPAGSYYPYGSYRIAENEKLGDVALELRQLRLHSDILRQNWQTSPLLVAGMAGQGIVAFLLVLVFPSLLAQGFTRLRNISR